MSYDYHDELERAREIRKNRNNPPAQPHIDKEPPRPDGLQRATARSAAATEGRQKRQPNNRRKQRMIAVIIAEIFTLLFIFGYAYVYKIYSKPQRLEFDSKNYTNKELTVNDLNKMKGYWMIAVFGVDSRGSNVGKGTNADVNMICCINQDTGDIKLVSVFRDSYLNIDDKGTYNKLNAAYSNGGPEQAVAALNKNLDLNITDYITFNWKAVADAINILGGVDLELTKSEFKYINSFITETVKSTGIASHQLKSAGQNHLDGVQAVAYGRLRLMDTDYARTERQRKIIELAFEKVKKADYSVLNNILVVVLPQVARSLDFTDLTNVALNITKYKFGETAGFPFARGDANMGKRGLCVIPKTLESNVVQLHQFLFADEIYTPTDTVKKISAKIAADSGMYSQGKASTGSAIPKDKDEPETSKALKETEETSKEPETDEFGNTLPESSGESTAVHPGIGETDEFGNLIDGPEESESGENPLWPGQTQPGQSESGQTWPGQSEPQTRPSQPGQSEPGYPGQTQPTRPVTPGTKPDATTSPDDISGPGAIGNESSAAVKPGGSEAESTSSVRPGESTPETTASSPYSPGGNPSSPGEAGNTPGDVIGNDGPGSV